MILTRDNENEWKNLSREAISEKLFMLTFSPPQKEHFDFVVLNDQDVPLEIYGENLIGCTFKGAFPGPSTIMKAWFKFRFGFSLWDVDELKLAEEEGRDPVPVYSSRDIAEQMRKSEEENGNEATNHQDNLS